MLPDTVIDCSCGPHVKGPGVERRANPIVEQIGSPLVTKNDA